MKIREIFKEDSLAGSRIIINNNFSNIKNEIEKIDNFFDFNGSDDTIKNEGGLLSKYVNTDLIKTKQIFGKDNILELYCNDILCAQFDNDGNLLIRNDSECNLNVNEKLANLDKIVIDVDGIANEVEQLLLGDEEFKLSIKNSIIDEEFINNLFENTYFQSKLEDFINKHYQTQPPVERCKVFSMYLDNNELKLHCITELSYNNDIKLVDFPGTSIELVTEDIINIINDHYGILSNEFILTYMDEPGEVHEILTGGSYPDYNINHELKFTIKAEEESEYIKKYQIIKPN